MPLSAGEPKDRRYGACIRPGIGDDPPMPFFRAAFTMLSLASCVGPRPSEAEPTAPPEPLVVAATQATSGDPRLALDDRVETGWTPATPAENESIEWWFEPAESLNSVRLTPCEGGAAFRMQMMLDQASGPEVSVRGVLPVQADWSEGVHRQLGLRILSVEGGTVPCLAKVEVRTGKVWRPLVPPREVRGRVRIASVDSPGSAWALVDGRPDTAWVELGIGDGQGEKIWFVLDEPLQLAGVEIWNGDQRTEITAGEFAKLARVKIETDAGFEHSIEVTEQPGAQKFSWPAVDTQRFALVIEEARSGHSKRPDRRQELRIAGIRLWDARGPVQMRTNDAAERELAVGHEIAVSSLGLLQNREWRSVCGHPRRRLKLRSNLSVFMEDAPGRVFEGTWDLDRADSPWVGVDLSGTWRPAGSSWAGGQGFEAVDGRISLARVTDLGAAEFRALMERWGRGESRVSCLTEELGAWPEAWSALVQADALVVEGVNGRDLLWREGY